MPRAKTPSIPGPVTWTQLTQLAKDHGLLLVGVRWVDASHTDGTMDVVAGDAEIDPIEMLSCGMLVQVTRRALTVALEVDESRLFRLTETIPKRYVKALLILGEIPTGTTPGKASVST